MAVDSPSETERWIEDDPTLDFDRQARFDRLLLRALDADPDDVEAVLERHCPDIDLRAEVLAVLQDEGELSGFLDNPAVDAFEPTELQGGFRSSDGLEVVVGQAPGSVTSIGPYLILDEIGVGGMGRVFLAEQVEPIKRRLAIKVMRTNLASPKAIARFSAERQAMANLAHPNIANLVDAGTTDAGNPFFAMDFIDGMDIASYCEHHRLSIEERLRLFIDVCSGVQHAHLKQILHRDIKPSNLLVAEVDGRPVPKIIDFGVAKALDEPLGPDWQLTVNMAVGTPSFMSPEAIAAAEGGPAVDTRTDIFSLGILLCQLLTGARPFERPAANLVKLFESVAEEKAIRPSRRLLEMGAEKRARIAKARRIEPAELKRRLEIDLDWIVLKAVAHDPNDRYISCSELAEDIEHHLNGKPVDARPASARYWLGKQVRRHRGPMAATGVLLLSLAAGFVFRSIEVERARSALAEAEAARREAVQAHEQDRAASLFLAEAVVGSLPTDDPIAVAIFARTLEQLGEEALESFPGQPLHRATTLNRLADLMAAAGLYESSHTMAKAAYDVRRGWVSPDHPDQILASEQRARALLALERPVDAWTELVQAIAAIEAMVGEAEAEDNAGIARLRAVIEDLPPSLKTPTTDD